MFYFLGLITTMEKMCILNTPHIMTNFHPMAI